MTAARPDPSAYRQRNTPAATVAFRLERVEDEDDGVRQRPTVFLTARFACSLCGQRSEGPTHPVGESGLPACQEPPALWTRAR